MQEKRDLRQLKNKQQQTYRHQNTSRQQDTYRQETRDARTPNVEKMEAEIKSDPDKQQNFNRMQEMYKQYQGKSEAELMMELTNMTRKNKEQGNLNNDRLAEMTQKLAPMLDSEQRSKMQGILEQLKKV